MKLSYRWLARHVDLSDTAPKEVARLLTLHVAEIEGTEAFAPQLSAVTVGHVLEREPHPDADKLGVCRVDVGAGDPLQIVCGAPNVGAGQRVAVATVGTVLPGDFKIKKSKIRGVESIGMICSVRELDLGDEHDGIWVLPDANGEPAAIGQPVAEALGFGDTVFEVDNKSITHRPDLWGHRGFARELAALLGRELLPLEEALPATGSKAGLAVEIQTPLCSRYLALPIDGVRVEASPLWMRLALLAVGQRPIDLLVDVSNYVQLDLGQPNHLFDRSRVDQGLVIRAAGEGERMKTLDGEERELTGADLVIASGSDPVALAGVMGGEASAVEAGTTQLLLEVANFDAITVRRTAARLGLRTDASTRFEKHLDPHLVPVAAARVIQLLREVQPDLSLPQAVTDVGDWTDPSSELELDPNQVRSLLGSDISDQGIAATLTQLGFRVDGTAPMKVGVPSFRATRDVTIPEDLIEEVGRSIGYGAIPEAQLVAAVTPPPKDVRRTLVAKIQDRLSGAARFHEALGYSFASDAALERLGANDLPHVAVINPVAEGESRVRRSVMETLIAQAARNVHHAEEVRLFEVGKGYRPEGSGESGEPAEVRELGLVLIRPPAGNKDRFDADALLELRGVVEDLVRALGLAPLEFGLLAEAPAPWLHPKATLGASGGVCELGRLDPRVANRFELDHDVAVATLSIEGLLSSKPLDTPYRPVPKFPGVKLDVALSCDEERPAAELAALIERSGKGLVASLELFDVYRGESVGEGRKSLAWHVVLQAADRTLEEKDLSKYLDRLQRSAEREGIELRRE